MSLLERNKQREMGSRVSSRSVNLCKALVSGVLGTEEGTWDTLACLLIWMSQSPKETICVEMLFKTVHYTKGAKCDY